ncbi:MAG: DegT/DnrJ/EryC1/StrS family aminotransferase [Xanthomonadales bacterium]|nr:dTDP-4-amino-4,6-dideoxy-D-glucose transaminase [Xanthomonadales bacterium]MCC6592260.1 DegT/DnrJ/EryC1/StrS family aminotransferase [Xanthomonadales bacterium]MCE7930674.1 dTDP-4-dehydro-6-deoxyglucose aminotransferase [Xanthomonadales bacterium PRO6]
MKSIRTASDLAIHGAPPAFAEIVHVGRPNMGSRARFGELVARIFENRWVTNHGPYVLELEERLAERMGVRHCVCICNGTLALEIAIRAVGLSGEVIVPSYTFIATAHALSWQGITPVFADIDPVTHNLDPAAVRRMITPRTSGIIGVHLWGRPAPHAELAEIAREHRLQLIYDAAHAFGGSLDGIRIGGLGRCEVFSFHATKVYNTFEGGAVATNDDELAQTVRLMRNFGFSGYDNVIYPGTNGKMTEICAAMGLVNLECLPQFVAANRANHQRYQRAFDGIAQLALLDYDPAHSPNYQYIVIELLPGYATPRDQVVAALNAENILARKYFWPGCHRMQPYRGLYPHAGLMLPHTQALADRVIVLPNGPELPEACIGTIADIVRLLA